MKHVTRSRTVPVPSEVRAHVRALIDALGVRAASLRLHLSRHAMLAIAAGYEATRGSIAIVCQDMVTRRQA